MLILIAFVLGFVGGLTYARARIITFVLLVILFLLAVGAVSIRL